MQYNNEKYKNVLETLDLSKLKNKKIFITGGTGFFGFWILSLIEHLNQNNFNISVCCLSRNPENFTEKNKHINIDNWLSFIEGDVSNFIIPSNLCFDYFIHGASNTKPSELQNENNVFETILSGTKNTLKQFAKSDAERFLFISSGAVYGRVENSYKTINEDSNYGSPMELDSYGKAKIAAEKECLDFFQNNKDALIISRCFAFIGYGIGNHLLPVVLRNQLINNNEIIIKGDGKAKRSYMHGKDLAIWLLKLLIDGKDTIYNVGSDVQYSVFEVAKKLCEKYANTAEIKIENSINQEPRPNYIPSIINAKKLNLDIWTSFEESIEKDKIDRL